MKRLYISLSVFVSVIALLVIMISVEASAAQHFAGMEHAMVADETEVVCQVPAAYGTIQEAVDDSSCTLVEVAAGTFTETVNITRTVTVQGRGSTQTTVDGNTSGSVFTIQAGAAVTLTGMTILNGDASSGGGINNQGTLTVNNSALSGNWARYGGGIANYNVLTVNDCTLSGNEADNGGGIANYEVLTVNDSTLNGNWAESGGGIYNDDLLTVNDSTLNGNWAEKGGGITSRNALTVTHSTLSGNEADNGGGIYSYGFMTVTHSTLSGNEADYGGGIDNGGVMTVTHSTLSSNEADLEGGGIYSSYNFVLSFLSSSIIANSLGGDCSGPGTFTSLGYNLDSDTTCSLTEPSDLPGTEDQLLGPLQDNGGLTWTHNLLPDSPAIDAGSPEACPSMDQRGFPRPVDGDGDGSARCDIGAVEYYEPVAGLSASNDGPTILGQPTTFTGTVTAGTVVSYSWDFGDDMNGSGAVVNHIYAEVGTFTATVTASNLVISKTKTSTVTVYAASGAGFTAAPTAGNAPLTVNFTNLSSGAYDACTWLFGDGGTSTNCDDPSYEYTLPGVYTVSFAVSGPGGSDSEEKIDYITVSNYMNWLPFIISKEQ